MKKEYLVIVAFLLMTVLTTCKSLQNGGGTEWATVDFSIDGPNQSSTLYSSSASSTNTELIIAVPASVTSLSISSYLESFYDKQLQDLTNYTVSLMIPLNTPIRLAKVVFDRVYTLDEISSNQPIAHSAGISDIFTVTGDDERKTVVITIFSKTITAFSFTAAANTTLASDVTAAISSLNIIATVPFGTNVPALVATFTTTGQSVNVGGTTQVSGTTVNDFSSVVPYQVTAVDSSTQNYAVSVAILAGEWGTAELVETDNVGDAVYPQVAFDGSGNAMAVWVQSDGIRNNTWANRYVFGSGWGTAELIETDNAGNAIGAQIAFDGGGNAIAVWYQSDGTRENIWANRYVAGSGWGTAELIETDNAGAASAPQVAFDVSGNAIAVWHQSDGIRTNIWANRYVVGSGWGIAELIETDNAGAAAFSQVAFDVSGNAIAVWYQSDATRSNIWANRYVAGSGWGTAELIETDNAGNATYPEMAFDVSGNAIAVWRQNDGTRENTWANRYVAGSGWGTAELIETDNAGVAVVPQVAFDGDGNAVAVWYQSDGTRENIWANRYAAGSGWGTAELIETDNTGTAARPQVAIDVSGRAMAVWYQNDGTRNNIWANMFQ